MKVITHGDITLAGPSVPPHNSFSSSKDVERHPKLIMDQVHISSSESTARVPSLMFKKLHINISLAEALAQMPKYAKMLKDLLTNKEKLLELANTSLNLELLSGPSLKVTSKNLDTLAVRIPLKHGMKSITQN
ncbi:hypothetical protein Tco_0222534 [Tanacetum coccineum]